jgi:2-phosphoglycerate kinase
MMSDVRVVIIGGSSNVGKTTLANHLSEKLGWRRISTDYLARHPGRPWRTPPETVPEHVAEHYLSLSLDQLITDVLRHYRSLWPQIEAFITEHATNPSGEGLVIEGSALWPESVAGLKLDHVSAHWLTASDELFQSRIYETSRFSELAGRDRAMVQKFLERTLRYNELMRESARRLGLPIIDVEKAASLDELGSLCLRRSANPCFITDDI